MFIKRVLVQGVADCSKGCYIQGRSVLRSQTIFLASIKLGPALD